MGNSKSELEVYDNLGIEYYYLGDIERAVYYHNRMIQGSLEPEGTAVKEISLNMLSTKREQTSFKYRNKAKTPLDTIPRVYQYKDKENPILPHIFLLTTYFGFVFMYLFCRNWERRSGQNKTDNPLPSPKTMSFALNNDLQDTLERKSGKKKSKETNDRSGKVCSGKEDSQRRQKGRDKGKGKKEQLPSQERESSRIQNEKPSRHYIKDLNLAIGNKEQTRLIFHSLFLNSLFSEAYSEMRSFNLSIKNKPRYHFHKKTHKTFDLARHKLKCLDEEGRNKMNKSYIEEIKNENSVKKLVGSKQVLLFQNSYSHLSNLRAQILKSTVLKDAMNKLIKVFDHFKETLMKGVKQYIQNNNMNHIFLRKLMTYNQNLNQIYLFK